MTSTLMAPTALAPLKSVTTTVSVPAPLAPAVLQAAAAVSPLVDTSGMTASYATPSDAGSSSEDSFTGIPGTGIKLPSDVTALVGEIQPDMTSTNRSIQSCAALDSNTKASWNDFYASWIQFAANSSNAGIFDASAQYDQALDFKTKLIAWQDQVNQVCPLSAPRTQFASSSWVKVALIGGGVLAALWMVSSAYTAGQLGKVLK